MKDIEQDEDDIFQSKPSIPAVPNNAIFNPISISKSPEPSPSMAAELSEQSELTINSLWREEDPKMRRLRRGSYLFFLIIIIVVVTIAFALRKDYYDSKFTNQFVNPFTTQSQVFPASESRL